MRLHAFTCGWLTAGLGNFLEGEKGDIRIPVPAFLVEHPKGTVVFDSGLHRDTQTDPKGRLGWLADIFFVEFRPGEEIAARLSARGFDPAKVTHLVTSHLHFDHVGGHEAIPNARVVIQKAEWEAGVDPELAKKNAFDPKDYDLGHERLLVDGEHDLFGDGRVVCLPTPGHTPGHQSLRVRLDDGDVILTADTCYFRRTLETLRLPPFGFDRELQLRSLERLRRLRDGGARLVFGHEPDGWDAVLARYS
jgi:glyoxylase-like metal-dependent hydrolase (beta-lactamase superfamily II)